MMWLPSRGDIIRASVVGIVGGIIAWVTWLLCLRFAYILCPLLAGSMASRGVAVCAVFSNLLVTLFVFVIFEGWQFPNFYLQSGAEGAGIALLWSAVILYVRKKSR